MRFKGSIFCVNFETDLWLLCIILLNGVYVTHRKRYNALYMLEINCRYKRRIAFGGKLKRIVRLQKML